MKLAFNRKGHYPEFRDCYNIYVNRSRTGQYVDETTYRKTIKQYCRLLSERLQKNGMVDLPCNIGIIAAAIITRRPQYRGKKFIGYGKINWGTGDYDETLKTFGIVFLPKTKRIQNLRCYGFVANRQLFKKMKKIYNDWFCPWRPLTFEDEMI